MKRVVPMGLKLTEDGIRNIAIYEPKPGKLEKTLADLTKRVLVFGEIEGYKLK